MSSMKYIKRYKNKCITKICQANKFSTPTAAIRFNLLYFPCYFIISSLTTVSGYSYVSLNLVTVPTVGILINFVTQLTNLHAKRTVWEI